MARVWRVMVVVMDNRVEDYLTREQVEGKVQDLFKGALQETKLLSMNVIEAESYGEQD